MPQIIENVVYQHAENVCSLWLQRHHAVDEPHYTFADLQLLDSRIEENVDGVRIAGERGVSIVEEFVSSKDNGAVFLQARRALQQADKATFDSLLQLAAGNEQSHSELASALAWSQPQQLTHWVRSLLESDVCAEIILGLLTCSAHGRNPGDYLIKYLVHNDSDVRGIAMKVAGEVGAVDRLTTLLEFREWSTEREKFEWARALALLGEKVRSIQTLETVSLSESDYRSEAADLYVMLVDSDQARSFLKKLDAIAGRERDVVRGFGLLGDPAAVNWLIDKTRDPALCRLAGESISMITGIDLAELDLESLDPPENFNDALNDDPSDSHVALDQDEDLPWPDTEQLLQWWGCAQKTPSGRYLLSGVEKNEVGFSSVILNGMQRQRNAAAINLALLKPGSRYLDTRLPCNKQLLWMNRMTAS